MAPKKALEPLDKVIDAEGAGAGHWKIGAHLTNFARPCLQSAPSLRIVVLEGPAAGSEHTAQHQTITVGRTRSSVFHIKDTSVSQQHAHFICRGQQWLVADKGSSNGTFMGEQQLEEGQGMNNALLHVGGQEDGAVTVLVQARATSFTVALSISNI